MKKCLLLLSLTILVACNRQQSVADDVDMMSVTVESATSIISGAADDQSGDTYAFHHLQP
jgi:hypothetical protein